MHALLLIPAVLLAAVFARSDGLKVTTLTFDKFLKDDEGEYSGYVVDLLDHIKEKAGLEFELSLVPDDRFGSLNEDGSWTGLIGEVANGNADLAVAPLTVTAKRSEVVDFTTPFMVTMLAGALKTPAPGEPLPFNTLADLAGSDNFVYKAIKGGSTRHLFNENSPYRLFKEIGQVMTEYDDEMPRSMAEGIDKIFYNGTNTVFLGENFMLEQGACGKDITVVPFEDMPKHYSIAVGRDSEHLDALNKAILELYENGVMAMLSEKWFPKNGCGEEKSRMCVCVEGSESAESSEASSAGNVVDAE